MRSMPAPHDHRYRRRVARDGTGLRDEIDAHFTICTLRDWYQLPFGRWTLRIRLHYRGLFTFFSPRHYHEIMMQHYEYMHTMVNYSSHIISMIWYAASHYRLSAWGAARGKISLFSIAYLRIKCLLSPQHYGLSLLIVSLIYWEFTIDVYASILP